MAFLFGLCIGIPIGAIIALEVWKQWLINS